MADWSDAQVQCLRALWDDGLSTAAIGRRLGVSKNAVIGKAHRLDLPGRPSPIYTDREPRQRPPRRVRGRATLPPLVSVLLPAPPPAPAVVHLEPQQAAALGRRPAMPPATKALPPAPAPKQNEPCRWLLNDRRPWKFCEEMAMDGSSYCAGHHKDAHVKVAA